MEHLTNKLKIFSLILLFSSVCYSVYPKNRIFATSGHRDESTTTTISSRIIESDPQPSTSGAQNSISRIKKTYETRVGENGQFQYVCTDCSHQTSFPSTASRHWYAEHALRIFKCTECEYEARHKVQVRQHHQAVHQGLRPLFRCQLCQYGGTAKRLLNEHIISKHLNLKQYKCTQCQFETARKGNLKRHMQSKHSDQQ